MTLINRPFAVRRFLDWNAFTNGIRAALPVKRPGRTVEDAIFKRFIFRGQADAAWSLRSTFDRNYSDKHAASRDALAKALVSEFYEECERNAPWRYALDDSRILAMA